MSGGTSGREESTLPEALLPEHDFVDQHETRGTYSCQERVAQPHLMGLE
jgi:hypothetical protein